MMYANRLDQLKAEPWRHDVPQAAYDTARVLGKEGIRAGIAFGTQAVWVAGHRATRDVDFIVPNEAWPEVMKLFPEGDSVTEYDSKMMRYQGAHGIEVEFMSHMNVWTPHGLYPLHLQQGRLAMQHMVEYPISNADDTLFTLSNEDLVIAKALMNRGQEQGKYDAADTKAVLEAQGPLNLEYMKYRLDETGALGPVQAFFATHQLPGFEELCELQAA